MAWSRYNEEEAHQLADALTAGASILSKACYAVAVLGVVFCGYEYFTASWMTSEATKLLAGMGGLSALFSGLVGYGLQVILGGLSALIRAVAATATATTELASRPTDSGVVPGA